MHHHPSIGRFAAKLVRDDVRGAYEPLESPDVEEEEVLTMPLVSR
jgi:hypothetical protein